MRILTAICGLLFIMSAHATPNNNKEGALLTPDQAIALLGLEYQPAINGQFIQQKYFKILKKPFISSGTFSANQQQFIWRTLAPINSGIVFENDKLYLENANGELTEQNKAQEIGYLMQQLLSGQFEQLSQHFLMMATEDKNCLKLMAKTKSFAQIFNQIKLCGQQRITHIILFDPQKNHTEISLSYDEVTIVENTETIKSH